MLNDKHIDYSQDILRAQFKGAGIVGLQSTLTFSSQTGVVSTNKYLLWTESLDCGIVINLDSSINHL